jgi:dTDP-4-dehydrorhamnose 3,5-epimerase-like enzyme
MRRAVTSRTQLAASFDADLTRQPAADFAEVAAYFDGRARLLHFHVNSDARGDLVPFDFAQLPFTPCRSFVVTNVPVGTRRGGHAHARGQQILVCVAGAVEVRLRHHDIEQVVTLTAPSDALYVASGVWSEQVYRRPNSTLLVFASRPYDPTSYIRD